MDAASPSSAPLPAAHLPLPASDAFRQLMRVAVALRNIYVFECFDRYGRLKWRETVKNIVVNEGLDDLLDKYLKGSGYTAAWYVGLVDNANWTAFAAGDTAAKINTTANPPTTNGWQECTAYDEATREALTLGSVSGQSVDNSASKASFTINATKTLKGGFIASVGTKGGTTGVLYGEVAFTSGNTRAVESGDTLNVTVTLTAASA